jgi:hypothetical protein
VGCVIGTTGPGVALGIANFMLVVPLVPMALWGGSLSDHLPKRAIIVTTQSLMLLRLDAFDEAFATPSLVLALRVLFLTQSRHRQIEEQEVETRKQGGHNARPDDMGVCFGRRWLGHPGNPRPMIPALHLFQFAREPFSRRRRHQRRCHSGLDHQRQHAKAGPGNPMNDDGQQWTRTAGWQESRKDEK